MQHRQRLQLVVAQLCRGLHHYTGSSMSAPSAVSAPSTSASPSACFTASQSPFQLCHSPLFASHHHARSPNSLYPKRAAVDDAHLDFTLPLPQYKPPDFTVASTVKHSPDPADCAAIPAAAWASRYPSSYPFVLTADSQRRPLNPFGRTGLQGRGKLYYWGPNHAADCILTREAEKGGGGGGERELLVIKRGDTGEWALVGGMIDKGELPEDCIRREFGEEALGMEEKEEGGEQAAGGESGSKERGAESAEEQAKRRRQESVLSAIFRPSNRLCVYRGYVDDSRNTDNAWLETCAFVFDLPHDLSKDDLQLFVGGSDAKAVKWIPIRDGQPDFDKLYASHKPMVLLAMRQREKWKQQS